jgi:hypothetical protein
MARWYAKQHIKTDPGVQAIYYLPTNAPDREIRFIEVNKLLADREDAVLEPIDFGVNTGMESEHKLYVLDVTPPQWDRIRELTLPLPNGWSLDNFVPFEQYLR